jgi:hypothetical protein
MSGSAEGRIAQLENELAEAHRRLAFTRDWCFSRMAKLRELADSLPEDKRAQFFAILAEEPQV